MVQPFLRDLLRKPIDTIQEYMNRPDYSDIVANADPFFSDRGEYEEWRNEMLQNKQPWGMVPLATAYNEDFDEHMPATWSDPGAKPFHMYTTPERAGLEGLFAENPELNYQNPSNKMFPWQANLPAIYAADKYINEMTGTDRNWDPEKGGEYPFSEAINVWDASDWFKEQRETEGPGKDWGGVNFANQGMALEALGQMERNPDSESFYNDLYKNIVPHEFGHELERDPEMWDVLPYPQTSGFNPGEGKPEKADPGNVWLHDILYNMGPHYSKTHPAAGINEITYTGVGPPGRDYRETHKWGQAQYALTKEQAMNYAALQNFSRRALNKEPHSYKSNQSWNMKSNKNEPIQPRGRPSQHFSTGGLVSLVL